MADEHEYVVDCRTGIGEARIISSTALADHRAQQAAQKTADDQFTATQTARVTALRTTLKDFRDNPAALPTDAIAALKALIALHHPDL